MRRIIAILLAGAMLLAAVPLVSAEADLANFVAVAPREEGRFDDVKETDWFASNVYDACELGLMKGTGETAFSPEKSLTVAEALVMACRLHSIYLGDGAEFVQGQPWYQVYWDYALENAMLAPGLLDPEAPISREQFAYVMCGALPSSELQAINEVAAIPDVTEQTTYGGFVYRLYRAGVLTGNNIYGVFTPTETIQRCAAAAIVTRMADPARRRSFTLADPTVTALETAGRASILLGETAQWTARPVPDVLPTPILWTAGNPGVATVDANGLVTALRPGLCNITATAPNGVEKTVLLTVISEPVTEVLLAGQVALKEGETTTWTASALPKTAYADLTWAAGNPGVATVEQDGTITAHRSGQCNITVSAPNGVKKTVMVTVKSEIELLEEQPYDVLGRYDSYHTNIYARTTNLILACKAIDGTVLQPGETFSFNKIVGERTAAKGYREATIYVSGETEPALGGGVCQVASTIYMAALLADLQIVERYPHMFPVTYVPPGMDATIYWGSLDFRFKNTSGSPLGIRASVSGGQVHIKLIGKKFSDRTVKMTWAGDRYHAQTYKNYYDPSGKLVLTNKCAYSEYKPHT